MPDIDKVIDEAKAEIKRFGDDVKALQDSFSKDLHDARQLAEDTKAEATGAKAAAESALVKYEELNTRLTKSLDQVGAALTRANFTARHFEIPKGDADEALEFKRCSMSRRDELKGISARRVKLKDGELDAYLQYKDNFEFFLRKDDRDWDREQYKALTTGNDPSGGYVVPVTMSARIMQIVYETSPLAQLATVETIGTDRLELPVDEGRGAAGWVGEEEARPETATTTFGSQIIDVHELYANPKITQRLAEDASVDIESWVTNKNGDEMGRIEATAFVLGNGVKKPRGILTYPHSATYQRGTIRQVNTGDANLITADHIKGLPFVLKELYQSGARWLMKRATLGAIAIMKDTTNQYLWVPGLTERGASSTLVGYPISLADDMPAVAAGALPLAFGDFRRGYTVVRRLGITMVRDALTAKPFIQFYTRMRVGADVVNFEAFILSKVST